MAIWEYINDNDGTLQTVDGNFPDAASVNTFALEQGHVIRGGLTPPMSTLVLVAPDITDNDPTPSLTEDANDIISAKPIRVSRIMTNDMSVDIGNLRLSNGGFALELTELASNRIFYPALTELETAGTITPYYWSLGASQPIPSLSDKSETFTGTSIQYRNVSAFAAVLTSIVIDSTVATADCNFITRLTSHTHSPAIFDYKRANDGVGFDLVVGENTITFPVGIFFEANTPFFATIESPNNISLLGQTLTIGGSQETLPYAVFTGRLATRTNIATEGYVDNANELAFTTTDDVYAGTLSNGSISTERFLTYTLNANGAGHSSIGADTTRVDIDETGFYTINASMTVINTDTDAIARLIPNVSLYVNNVLQTRENHYLRTTVGNDTLAPDNMEFDIEFLKVLNASDVVRVGIQARTGSVSTNAQITSSTLTVRKIEATGTVDGSATAAEIKTLYESNSDTNAFNDAAQTKLAGIATGAEVNVQADWNEASNTNDSFILNKPAIPSGIAPFSAITGSPSDNLALAAALDAKANNSDIDPQLIKGTNSVAQSITISSTGQATIVNVNQSNVNTSSSFFTLDSNGIRVQRAGLYAIIGGAEVLASAGSERVDATLQFRINNLNQLTPRDRLYVRNAATGIVTDRDDGHITDFVELNANDLVQLVYVGGASTNVTITVPINLAFLNLLYLGPGPAINNAAQFTSFTADVPQHVPAGTMIGPPLQFNWTTQNTSKFTGNLTISVGAMTLGSNIDPSLNIFTATSFTPLNVANIGNLFIFNISDSDGTPSATYEVRGQSTDEFIYFGRSTSNNPASIDTSSLSSERITSVGDQFNVPFTGIQQNDTFMILYPSNVTFTIENLSAPGQSAFSEFGAIQTNIRTISGQTYNAIVQTPLIAGVSPTYRITIQTIS